MSKPLRLIVFVVLFLALAQPAWAAYQLPVNGSVTDAFRPPATPYGAGNRGWEFATTPGETVKAANEGTVTFAGQVGGVLNVVIQHPDGLLTTYSKLASVTILNGMHVNAGDKLGTAAADTYFGVRENGEYIDPAPLFESRPYLVSEESADVPPLVAQIMSAPQLAWLQQPAPWPKLAATLSRLHL